MKRKFKNAVDVGGPGEGSASFVRRSVNRNSTSRASSKVQWRPMDMKHCIYLQVVVNQSRPFDLPRPIHNSLPPLSSLQITSNRTTMPHINRAKHFQQFILDKELHFRVSLCDISVNGVDGKARLLLIMCQVTTT